MNILDSIDKGIQHNAAEIPGRNISAVIEPFLSERSESVLRARIRQLSRKRLLRLEKTRHEILVYPGEVAIEEFEEVER